MKRITILSVTLLALALLPLSTASAASTSKAMTTSSAFPGVPNGYGYAAYVISPTGSGSANYGPGIPVSLSCTTPPTTNTITNSGPALPTGTPVSSGSAVSTITIGRTATNLTVQTSEDIHNLSILGGIITANEVHAIVTSTSEATGATSTNSSSFSGLTVAGLLVNSKPAPNTTIALPGLGSVVLNEQSGPFNGTHTTSIGVVMMDVHITDVNSAGLAPGTHIIVAHVESGVLPIALTSIAYGLYGSGLGGSTPTIGPVDLAGIPCTGGSSTVGSNGFTSPAIGSTGNETSTASGQMTSSSASATAQNSVSNVNLLSGLVSADKVATIANASWNGTGSRSGSATFVNAKIAGSPLPSNTPPNTRRNLPGIGYVVVNEQFGSNDASGAAENVIGFDIYITVANNRLNLPAGARIIVSCASTGASSY